MDKIASSSDETRRDLFVLSAAQRNVSAMIIEKDFWVCWALRHVFLLPKIGENLIFKGGTSLSKVFDLIRRFSEDVDLSVRRDYLGFVGEKDPEFASSVNQRRKRVEELRDSCRAFVQGELKSALNKQFTQILGSKGWSLLPDKEDLNVLIFNYPSAVGSESAGTYIQTNVRLELGAGSDPYPIGTHEVIPYAAVDLPSAFSLKAASVVALEAERTFWEKATLLHAEYHRPADKPTATRISRHLYDLAIMAPTELGQRSVSDLKLLERVATHKSVYFASAWANYGSAKPGSLKLSPHPDRIETLARDYAALRYMFFEEPPRFDEVLGGLKALEERINKGS